MRAIALSKLSGWSATGTRQIYQDDDQDEQDGIRDQTRWLQRSTKPRLAGYADGLHSEARVSGRNRIGTGESICGVPF